MINSFYIVPHRIALIKQNIPKYNKKIVKTLCLHYFVKHYSFLKSFLEEIASAARAKIITATAVAVFDVSPV